MFSRFVIFCILQLLFFVVANNGKCWQIYEKRYKLMYRSGNTVETIFPLPNCRPYAINFWVGGLGVDRAYP